MRSSWSRLVLGVWLLAACLLLAPAPAWARDVPPLRGHVNDTAGLLSSSAAQQLEQRLTRYEAQSHHQFALLTIDSLEGDPLEDFSIRVVEAWKLGQKGKDDGLLLLVAQRERKLRIEVGYGLEGDITDAFSSRVIRNVLTPALRAGKPDQGVAQAFDVLMHKASGDAVPDNALAPPPAERRERPSPLGLLALLLFVGPLFLLPLLLHGGRRRRVGGFWGGYGGYGGFGGGGFGGGGFGGGGGFSGGGGGFGGGGSSGSW